MFLLEGAYVVILLGFHLWVSVWPFSFRRSILRWSDVSSIMETFRVRAHSLFIPYVDQCDLPLKQSR